MNGKVELTTFPVSKTYIKTQYKEIKKIKQSIQRNVLADEIFQRIFHKKNPNIAVAIEIYQKTLQQKNQFLEALFEEIGFMSELMEDYTVGDLNQENIAAIRSWDNAVWRLKHQEKEEKVYAKIPRPPFPRIV